jgi:hypothetical protein
MTLCAISRLVQICAIGRYSRGIHAVADLLTRQKLEFVFVGEVARAAWLGGEAARGSLDAVVLMGPQQKNQVAMMASNRGFRVDKEEIEQSIELDLVPLNFVDPEGEGEVRVHVLVATNALYGRMVAAGVEANIDDRTVRVPAAEDFALLATLADDDASLGALVALPAFDREGFNQKLISIGLGGRVVAG